MIYINFLFFLAVISAVFASPVAKSTENNEECISIQTGNKLLNSPIKGYVAKEVWATSFSVIRNSFDHQCRQKGLKGDGENDEAQSSAPTNEIEAFSLIQENNKVLECYLISRKIAVISTMLPCYNLGKKFTNYEDIENTKDVFFNSDFNELRLKILENNSSIKKEIANAFPCREECDYFIKLQFSHIQKGGSNSCRNLPLASENVEENPVCYTLPYNEVKPFKLSYMF